MWHKNQVSLNPRPYKFIQAFFGAPANNSFNQCCYWLKYLQKAERKPDGLYLNFLFLYLGLDFSWQIGEVEDWPEVHKLFDVVRLSCSADDSVKPMPAISIWAGFDELPHKELVNSFE